MSKVVIVAGESSGDLHGSNLAKALKELEPDIQLYGLGGKKMAECGVSIFRDVTKHATVGVFEGLLSYPRLIKTFFSLLAEIKRLKPDLVILIDYPEFNLRLAKRLKRTGIPVIYYICPQVWAWRQYRTRALAKYVDKLFVILPFEEEYYRRHNVKAQFVGHPVLDSPSGSLPHASLRQQFGIPPESRIIGLLPGSRRGEVKRLFPVLKESARLIRRQLPNTSFVVGLAPQIKESKLHLDEEDIKMHISRDTPEVMRSSDLLLTCSGTATLEAAVLGTPMVILYRVNTLTWMLFIHLLSTRHMGLCNILAGRRVVPELVQWHATPNKVAKCAIAMLQSPRLPEIRESLLAIREKLGKPGASKRAAEAILEFLRKTKSAGKQLQIRRE
jgi:lipid-A-disaccharide synthase